MPEIEIVSQELVVARGVTIDYDLTPEKAFKLLPEYSNQKIKRIPLPVWNGGKSGQRLIDIHLVRPQRSTPTTEGRRLVVAGATGLTNALPIEVAALADLRRQIWEAEIWWVAALQSSDEHLWRGLGGYRQVFCLDCDPGYPGFSLYWADCGWLPRGAFAGLPQADA